jgi:hypothetical protein
MLEIRHLQLLTALREQGSLAAAAEDLYVTASAVSHQLKEIENYYGVSLVNRRSRPLSFTPAGKEVLAGNAATAVVMNSSMCAIRALCPLMKLSDVELADSRIKVWRANSISRRISLRFESESFSNGVNELTTSIGLLKVKTRSWTIARRIRS